MEVIDLSARMAASRTIPQAKSVAATRTGICPPVVADMAAAAASERFEGPDNAVGRRP